MGDVFHGMSRAAGRVLSVFVCLFGCIVLLSGCADDSDAEHEAAPAVSKVIYEGNNIHCLAADGKKHVYIAAASMEETGQSIICMDEDGGKEEFDLSVINENKEITYISSMVLANDCLYIAADAGMGFDDQHVVLYKMDLKKNTVECIREYSDYSNVKNLLFLDGRLLMLAQGKKQKDRQPVPANQDDIFEYSGEVLVTQDGEVLFDDFPVACDRVDEKTLLMYAHSDQGGYYFTSLSIEDGRISGSEPVYKDLGQLTSLTVTGDETVLYTSGQWERKGLLEINLSDDVCAEIQPDAGMIAAQGDICVSGDVAFYRTEDGICCFNYDGSKKDNKVMRIIESERIGPFNAPYGCGYQMDISQLGDEEMSLRVLSQDSDYDLCFMQSGESFGYQVREKGSFYPLTDIRGVQEYLDACFPYLKEAATDADGEIWMLPVAVEADALIFDDEMLKGAGVELEGMKGLDEFTAALKNLPDEKKDCVNVPASIMQNILLTDYACRNESFNTEQFRELAEQLIAMDRDELFAWHGEAYNALVQHDQNGFLCSVEQGAQISDLILSNQYASVRRVYGIDEEKPVPVKCYFACINAATDNLSASLSYMEALCSYLMQEEDTMMLADKEKYTDTEVTRELYDLYADGEVVFAVPQELYLEEWEKYKAGELEFDQMVKEADRKLKMYKEE